MEGEIFSDQWRDREYAEHYNQLMGPGAEEIMKYLDSLRLTRDDVLVDIGCGNGDVLLGASKRVRRAVGVDISPHQVSEARRKLTGAQHVEIVESSFLGWDPGEIRFTRGSARKSLHHLTDPEKKEFMVKISPYFKKGSLFVIEDGIFTFPVEDLKRRMPEVLGEAESYYGARWPGMREDFVFMMENEYPTGVDTWEASLTAGGFTMVERIHVTCFYARIVARKEKN